MVGLTDLDDGAWDAVLQRADNSCVVFANHPLPRGCTPARHRVGVERTGAQVLLHVDRDVRYSGDEPVVARWVADGTLRFDSADLLRTQVAEWLSNPDRLTTDRAADDVPRRSFVDPEQLFGSLQAEVIGQDACLDTLARLAARHVARVDPQRPTSALLAGPTGVGKTSSVTALAHALAEATTEEWGFVRLDMGEFQERHSTAKLVGAPPGYIGYNDGSPLAEEVAARPFTVVLVDEIEKAHPNVFATFLQILDAGRLTPASQRDGIRTVDMTRTLVLFTSNLAADQLSATLQALSDRSEIAVDAAARGQLRPHIRPELLGRLARILVYRPLSDSTRRAIVERSVHRTTAMYGLQLAEVTQEAVTELLAAQRERGGGARSIEQVVDALLGDAFVRLARTGADSSRVIGAPLDVQPPTAS